MSPWIAVILVAEIENEASVPVKSHGAPSHHQRDCQTLVLRMGTRRLIAPVFMPDIRLTDKPRGCSYGAQDTIYRMVQQIRLHRSSSIAKVLVDGPR